jgi:prolyl 4-hydroxylase
MRIQECDHIVNVSKPLMMRSTVVGEGGASVVDHIRTSYGTFLRSAA